MSAGLRLRLRRSLWRRRCRRLRLLRRRLPADPGADRQPPGSGHASLPSRDLRRVHGVDGRPICPIRTCREASRRTRCSACTPALPTTSRSRCSTHGPASATCSPSTRSGSPTRATCAPPPSCSRCSNWRGWSATSCGRVSRRARSCRSRWRMATGSPSRPGCARRAYRQLRGRRPGRRRRPRALPPGPRRSRRPPRGWRAAAARRSCRRRSRPAKRWTPGRSGTSWFRVRPRPPAIDLEDPSTYATLHLRRDAERRRRSPPAACRYADRNPAAVARLARDAGLRQPAHRGGDRLAAGDRWPDSGAGARADTQRRDRASGLAAQPGLSPDRRRGPDTASGDASDRAAGAPPRRAPGGRHPGGRARARRSAGRGPAPVGDPVAQRDRADPVADRAAVRRARAARDPHRPPSPPRVGPGPARPRPGSVRRAEAAGDAIAHATGAQSTEPVRAQRVAERAVAPRRCRGFNRRGVPPRARHRGRCIAPGTSCARGSRRSRSTCSSSPPRPTGSRPRS